MSHDGHDDRGLHDVQVQVVQVVRDDHADHGRHETDIGIDKAVDIRDAQKTIGEAAEVQNADRMSIFQDPEEIRLPSVCR